MGGQWMVVGEFERRMLTEEREAAEERDAELEREAERKASPNVSGGWRAMDAGCYKAAERSGYRPPELLDVDESRLRLLANERKVRGIVFELTHRPRLVKR